MSKRLTRGGDFICPSCPRHTFAASLFLSQLDFSSTQSKDRVMYKKLVTKGTTDYCYLKVRLDFEDAGPETSAIEFKQIILEAINSLFGLAVSATLIDILRYDRTDRTAVVRIYHKFLTKIWSSLSFYGNYRGRACAFRILQVSAHLMAMACNSRSMVIEVVEK